jgi:hypothetical protein
MSTAAPSRRRSTRSRATTSWRRPRYDCRQCEPTLAAAALLLLATRAPRLSQGAIRLEYATAPQLSAHLSGLRPLVVVRDRDVLTILQFGPHRRAKSRSISSADCGGRSPTRVQHRLIRVPTLRRPRLTRSVTPPSSQSKCGRRASPSPSTHRAVQPIRRARWQAGIETPIWSRWACPPILKAW